MDFENRDDKGSPPKTKQEVARSGEKKYKRIEVEVKRIIDQCQSGPVARAKANKMVSDLLKKELNISPALEYSMFDWLLAMRTKKELTEEEFEKHIEEFFESLPDEGYPERKM